MTAISVYDLTDEQVDAIVAARQALAPKYSTEALDRLATIRADYERAVTRKARRAEETRIKNTRPCTRCGIDTTADICVDCLDVLALEQAS